MQRKSLDIIDSAFFQLINLVFFLLNLLTGSYFLIVSITDFAKILDS